ncbi:MAG: transporter [Deltaproteobacteria bacterium]|nr:transporter [Deltaproteobacteria bacterium]
MDTLAKLLSDHELLLVFLVVMGGVLLGRVTLFGTRLGVAGVLFTGIAVSALVGTASSPLAITPILRDLGLVLFVYCIGISSGPGFFRAWRNHGIRLNLAVITSLAIAGALAVLLGQVFALDRGYLTGVLCGALTNTPALGAAAERVAGTELAAHPAVGYAVAYPFGVFGALLVLRVFARVRRSRLDRERAAMTPSTEGALKSANFAITNPALDGKAIGELRVRDSIGVMISRLARKDPGHPPIVVTKYTTLALGDTVTAVGPGEALAQAETYFGQRSEAHLELERGQIDMRRVLVSKKSLVGKRLSDLHIDQRFGAQVTRLRRADVDLLPSPDMRLELGDRIRVVAPTEKLPELARFFGDSERDLAQLDFVALAIGIAAGLLLALLPVPGPGAVMHLGVAGGTLLASLFLGRLGRTGPLVWSLPYEVMTSLRDLGLLLFLAGVGVSAGANLGKLEGTSALGMFAAGATITVVASVVGLALMHRWAGASVIGSMGATAGLQTQPATLGAAYEFSGRSEETYVAYALVYPVAMIGKILLAQILVMLLA